MYANDLIDKVAEKAGLTKKDAKKAIDAVFACASDALVEDGKLTVIGFGTLAVRARAERKGVNPKTGEAIVISAQKSVGFKPGKDLKARLNG